MLCNILEVRRCHNFLLNNMEMQLQWDTIIMVLRSYKRREVTAHVRRLYHLPFSTNNNARICPLRKITPIPLCLRLRSSIPYL